MHTSNLNQHAQAQAHFDGLIKAGMREYADSVFNDTRELAYALDDLACAIRNELSVKTDADAFKRQTQENFEKLEKVYGDAMRAAAEQAKNNDNNPS